MAIKPYDHTTYPSNGALGSSAALRNELDAIEAGFDMVATEIETALTGSETAAATATTKAAEALTSANNADISEAAAAASAAAALASENAAALSETNVAANALAVANTYDAFDDRYLGTKSSAPTLDNDGNALQQGTLYWDSTLNLLRGYNGTTWVNLPATTASNVANVPSGNLSATTVQAALNELDADLTITNAALASHLADAADAHDASAISYAGGTGMAATDVEAAIDELATEKVSKTSDTGSAILPVGTTAQRDGGTPAGYLRYNNELGQFEGYGSAGWGKVGGGATGGGSNAAFYENDITVTDDYTITSGKNAGTFGPVTIADTKTVTVPTGSTWSIV